jgi:glycosyltransferase involved in cell wall biosynthesis
MTITSKSIFAVPVAKQFIKILFPASLYLEEKDVVDIPREKVAIVLPTYNERDNIIRLIPELEDVLENAGVEGHIIFVDDNSKDGTGTEAIRLARAYGNITVIQRPGKLGLGSAYRVGFKRAIQMGMDIVFMMDSDLSHKPAYIPKFLDCLKKTGAGLVIGLSWESTRFTTQPQDFGLSRLAR